jgi:hypothetical protein
MKKTQQIISTILFAGFICLLSQAISGQTIIRRYDFDSNLSWGGPDVSSETAVAGLTSGQIDPSRPTDATYGAVSATNTTDVLGNSTTSFGRSASALTDGNNGTVELTFPAIPPSAFTGNNDLYISFRLAAISAADSGGLDLGDVVRVSVSLDNGATFTNEASISGNNNAVWNYNNNQARQISYDGNNTIEASKAFQPASASNNGTNGVSKLTIFISDSFLNSSTGVVFRVTLNSNQTTELWAVDDFIAYLAAPSAAESAISGRVVNSNGRGIRNVRLVLSGGNLTQPVYTQTTPFGFYRFDGLDAGQTYVVTVFSKSYYFGESSRVITLHDNVADADFVAEGLMRFENRFFGKGGN